MPILLFAIGVALCACANAQASDEAAVMTSSGFHAIEGDSLYYEVIGSDPPAGPIDFALVFIHDGLAHSVVWDAQVAAFAPAYTIVRYDRRGYGRSTQPGASYSNTADLHSLLVALQVKRAVLIGASAGGGLAIDYALAHPERVVALILAGPVVDGLGYSLHFMERAYANFGADMNETIERWAADRYAVAPGNDEARKSLLEILRLAPQNLDPMKHRWAEESRNPALPRLGEVAVPTLLITGAEDIPDVHAHMGAIEAGIRGARREVIAKAGHLSFLERSQDFNRCVEEFLSLIALDPGSPRVASFSDPDDSSPWREYADGFVPVKGSALYYQSIGPSIRAASGTNEAVVLLHGGSLDHRMWDGSFTTLAGDFRVIRYDSRGHGLSQSPYGSYRNYEDLRVLLEALHVEHAHLVGLSLGCRIAVDFAIAYPAQVASLTLVSPGVSGYSFDAVEERACTDSIVTAWMRADFARAAEAFVRGWCDGPQRAPGQVDPAVRATIKRMGIANMRPDREFGAGLELDPPAFGRLNEVHAPTLAMLGVLDMPGIHTVVRAIGEQVSGAQVETFERSAHMIPLEESERFHSILAAFLKRERRE